ncbi:biotin transport system substrate-specific component [Breznakia sp. PF5-3]|uniref:biotin transporter BioY n=1 Tax=unclassified Breznakia TaxID=2623764 RepID=UPI0024053482|nr:MULTISPECIES: biotin transporter BioY [unclassified Breznakia]MDL2276182.1 biotin transporter BioY [Breznakia sp. OttesenSCG-928-G09]MDF9824703.1 biotin transport system substrate-specific component [Breznakia sp. PM6-1]MDF9835366.1 biotin transport system substrate-specific component [Breznakia sp. PF5-3]MDF9836965.1 biotin transport system substrate-specific component [Breznakia sp. PFB2-8]MDF9859601.1 biotin transport system substrate-specific component [Breznakia sp. PH5-24]
MKLTIKEMCISSMFALIIAMGAFIKIPISLVPVTMQTLFVILCALLLGSKLATLSVLLYIAIGLVGIPVFANGGGITYVLQPSFGYLLGFLLAAKVVGSLKDKFTSFGTMLCLCIFGMLIIYAIGFGYFYFIQNIYFGKNFKFGWMFYNLFLVYLPGDILACIAAAIIKQKVAIVVKLPSSSV